MPMCRLGFVLTLSILALSPVRAQPDHAFLAGKVTSDVGESLANATITEVLTEFSTASVVQSVETDSDGLFNLHITRPSLTVLRISAPGYQPAVLRLPVTDLLDSIRLTIRLRTVIDTMPDPMDDATVLIGNDFASVRSTDIEIEAPSDLQRLFEFAEKLRGPDQETSRTWLGTHRRVIYKDSIRQEVAKDLIPTILNLFRDTTTSPAIRDYAGLLLSRFFLVDWQTDPETRESILAEIRQGLPISSPFWGYEPVAGFYVHGLLFDVPQNAEFIDQIATGHPSPRMRGVASLLLSANGAGFSGGAVFAPGLRDYDFGIFIADLPIDTTAHVHFYRKAERLLDGADQHRRILQILDPGTPIQEGRVVPEFSLTITGKNDRTVTLYDFAGRYLLLDFRKDPDWNGQAADKPLRAAFRKFGIRERIQ